jgi:hypothetical protein
MFRTVLLVGACLLSTIAVMAQNPQGADRKIGTADVAFTFNPVLSQTQPGSRFWMEGGSIQLHDRFYKGFGVVGDLAVVGTGNMNNSGVGLTLMTATFGPRYTFVVPKRKTEVYGQTLIGWASGMKSAFTSPIGTTASANSFAANLGGGVNLNLNKQFALRLLEASWVRTSLPNGAGNTQNMAWLGTGLVVHF